jgi:hypothetical protein
MCWLARVGCEQIPSQVSVIDKRSYSLKPGNETATCQTFKETACHEYIIIQLVHFYVTQTVGCTAKGAFETKTN